MNTQTATQTDAEACPASGRTARWCLDQTHAACYAAIAEAARLDSKIEATLP